MAVAIIVFEPTTVTTIPVASTVVVAVVAYFVTHPGQHFAWLAAFCLRFIETCTFITVCERLRSQLFVGFCATVATVPITTTFVIEIVAVPVTFPGVDVTFRYADMFTLEVGIVAGAIHTVVVIIFVSTAVATVPTASAIVVLVVAITVTTEMIHCTRAIAIYARVFAGTIFTIFMSFVSAAAIAVIPATLANIISVIAIFITLPYFHTRLIVAFENATVFRLFFLVTKALASAAVTLELTLKRLASVICHAVELITRQPKT